MAEAAQDLQPFVFLRPEEDEVILWESWVRLEVVLNRAKSKRVSISFNYAWV
ncbi:MAG: putative 2OG-Fe(II) oxygenase [Hyphomonadaceae bacterium]